MTAAEKIEALRLFGADGYPGDETNLNLLKTYRTNALTQIAAGHGSQVVSASGNGVAVTLGNGMRADEWFTMLQRAIALVEAKFGTSRRSRVSFLR